MSLSHQMIKSNCPSCGKRPAILSNYGLLNCIECRDRQARLSKPDYQIEFTSEDIKSQRREYFKSTIQPFRSGELSKEYLEVHGTKGIQASAEEIANAKPVWTDLAGYENRKRTK